MLFAAVDVNSQAYAFGHLLGALPAGVICGLWPLSAGSRKGRPVLGVVGLGACVISGALLGCLLALPMAVFFRLLIGVLDHPTPPGGDGLGGDGPGDRPFNPYANGKRSAF
ncbi:MAG: hypothetical protein JWO38_6185 [Gemmataceae bacterium]|nr:hypothetical protein [Gemmataceae bacterium]